MKYLGEQIMEEQGFCELSFSFFHIENCCLLVGTKVKSDIKETVIEMKDQTLFYKV